MPVSCLPCMPVASEVKSIVTVVGKGMAKFTQVDVGHVSSGARNLYSRSLYISCMPCTLAN